MSENAYFTFLKSEMSVKIVINITIPWIHRWKNCDIDEVSYLKDYHRHLFYIRCEKKVRHNDRDIEIISFKTKIENYLWEEYWVMWNCEFWDMSCEMIAELLMKEFSLDLCEVLEDWENGALLTK